MSVVELRAAPPLVMGGVLAFLPLVPGLGFDAEDGVERLEPAERALLETMSPSRQTGFIAGRIALRAATSAVQSRAPHSVAALAQRSPILRTARGAPQMPEGMTGSISHKRTGAVALAALATHGSVGVDLEDRPRSTEALRPADTRRALATRILTKAEQHAIADLDAHAHRQATLLHFALKEAVYKAIDPFVQRYVRFTEVELDFGESPVAFSDCPSGGGAASVRLLLDESDACGLTAHAWWMLDDQFVIAAAVARTASL